MRDEEERYLFIPHPSSLIPQCHIPPCELVSSTWSGKETLEVFLEIWSMASISTVNRPARLRNSGKGIGIIFDFLMSNSSPNFLNSSSEGRSLGMLVTSGLGRVA